MASIEGGLMGLNVGFVAVTLLVVAALLVVLWVRARMKLVQAKSLLAQKVDELEQKGKDREQLLLSSQSQVSKLKERIEFLSAHTYIAQFERNHVYTLIAKAKAEIDRKSCCYGLVSEDDGAPIPFLTHGGLEELEAGDRFSLVGRRPTGILSPRSSTHLQRSTSYTPLRLSESLPADVSSAREEADYVAGEVNATVMAPPADRPLDYQDYYKGLPYLKVIEGKDRGALFYVPFTQCKIGRDPKNTVALDDKGSSRIHAFVGYRDHGFILCDNHSTNGTYQNGARIEEAKLHFGDMITIGNTQMVFTSEGYELREKSPEEAIELFEKCLSVEPNFILGLKYLAFLLERDVRRKGEAAPIYARLKRLEKVS